MPLRTLLTGTVAWIASAAIAFADVPCDLGDVKSNLMIPGQFSVQNQTVGYTINPSFHFAPTGDLVKVIETDAVDLTALSSKMPAIIDQMSRSLPHNGCGQDVNLRSTSFGVNTPNAIAGAGYKGTMWKCVSADVPCPTWSQPFRFCRKEAKTILCEADISATIVMSPRVDAGTTRVQVNGSSSGHLNDQCKILGGILGGAVLGPLGVVAFNNLAHQIEAKFASFNIHDVITLPSGGAEADDFNKNFQPVAESARFVQTGSGPASRVILSIVRSAELRPGTACFFRSRIPH